MKNQRLILLLIIVGCHFSCKKFLEIGPPKSSLVQETVFQNNDQATSAIIGVYTTIASSSGWASGGPSSITCYAGLSADELIGYSVASIPFYENQLVPELPALSSLYSSAFKTIYTANAALEGIAKSSGITPPVKAQLEGEAYFIRAFSYFYLVNLFGDVPLQLTTDYRVTQETARTKAGEVYAQIISDLKLAESLLPENYVTASRVRPNKSVVQALLARVYLYLQDWENAEKYASTIITKSGTYELVDVDEVFLSGSKEAIWQLFPTANSNAQDGNLFILFQSGAPTYVSLRSDFALNGFEANDKRKSAWVKSYVNSTGTYYYPFKYKIRSATTPTEYSVVFRLAEQYLIRAEARINQSGKIGLGIADLNKIRDRARPVSSPTTPSPLPPLTFDMNKNDALLAVEKERFVELFSEWGHRWFDLKRTERSSILGAIKPLLQSTDLLYAIPANEISRNRNITQNTGY